MAHILIDKQHKPLIKAAIAIGDWLLTLDNLTSADKDAVKAIQKALSKLPKVNDGTLAMYGFSIERGNDIAGLVRGWDVSLEYFANDLERQGGLELFSSYIPIPETTDKTILAQKMQSEVYFQWPLGDVCNYIIPDQQQQWLNDVKQPLQFAEPGDRLRIEIVYQDYYSEVEYPLFDAS